jgi:hypothetical protein
LLPDVDKTLDRAARSPHLEAVRLLITVADLTQIAPLVSATARPRVEGLDCLLLLRDRCRQASRMAPI